MLILSTLFFDDVADFVLLRIHRHRLCKDDFFRAVAFIRDGVPRIQGFIIGIVLKAVHLALKQRIFKFIFIAIIKVHAMVKLIEFDCHFNRDVFADFESLWLHLTCLGVFIPVDVILTICC